MCTSLYVCEYGLLLMRTVHLNGLCVYDIVCGVTVLSTVTPQCTGLDVCVTVQGCVCGGVCVCVCVCVLYGKVMCARGQLAGVWYAAVTP